MKSLQTGHGYAAAQLQAAYLRQMDANDLRRNNERLSQSNHSDLASGIGNCIFTSQTHALMPYQKHTSSYIKMGFAPPNVHLKNKQASNIIF